ncbi:MAG: fluoride efflux transporter CrcB [Chloroflexi bacterium]|nr:fluoride efflux transporter CrcB [Chloroflexota bacterium]
MHWILVAIGGAIGALMRYAIDRAVVGAIGPTVLGTFLINISGSFILGLFIALAAGRTHWPPGLSFFVAVGFLGAYTTFSTLTVASVQLFDNGEIARGLLNIFGSIAVGLLAAFLGIVVGRAL